MESPAPSLVTTGLEPSSKKQRTDGDENIEIPTVKANDFITLIFVDSFDDGSSSCDENFYSKPTFTHQLFEDEKIDFLTETTRTALIENYQPSCIKLEMESQPGLLVYIRCNNLSHYAATRSISIPSDREMLMAKIHPALPPHSICQKAREINSNLPVDFLPLDTECRIFPPGRRISRFESGAIIKKFNSNTTLSSSSSSFEIFLATEKDNGATELLQRAEKIAMWYIETADSVDFSDERWEVLFLYHTRKKSGDNLKNHDVPGTEPGPVASNFAGYITLFTFHNPFIGSKIRVCQALVLPHMQGRGLGRKMLLSVYELAQSRNSIVEVTVEDPAPAFERLRDMVDCEWVFLHISKKYPQYGSKSEEMEEISVGMDTTTGSSIDDTIGSTGILEAPQEPVTQVFGIFDVMKFQEQILQSSSISSAAEKERQTQLKLTPAQTFFAYEALQFAVLIFSILIQNEIRGRIDEDNEDCNSTILTHLNDEVSPQFDDAIETLTSLPDYKAFRLRVKRRILNANKHLKGPNMQRDLEELFEELRVRYIHCLKPISRFRVN